MRNMYYMNGYWSRVCLAGAVAAAFSMHACMRSSPLMMFYTSILVAFAFAAVVVLSLCLYCRQAFSTEAAAVERGLHLQLGDTNAKTESQLGEKQLEAAKRLRHLLATNRWERSYSLRVSDFQRCRRVEPSRAEPSRAELVPFGPVRVMPSIMLSCYRVIV